MDLDRFDRPRHARVVPFNRLQIFTIAPNVRIELEAIQAIVIVPIIRVIYVVFPYDRPDRLVLFWDDWDDDRDDHMVTRIYAPDWAPVINIKSFWDYPLLLL